MVRPPRRSRPPRMSVPGSSRNTAIELDRTIIDLVSPPASPRRYPLRRRPAAPLTLSQRPAAAPFTLGVMQRQTTQMENEMTLWDRNLKINLDRLAIDDFKYHHTYQPPQERRETKTRMQKSLNFIDRIEFTQRDIAKDIKTRQGRVNADLVAMMTGTGVRHSATLDLFNRNYPAPQKHWISATSTDWRDKQDERLFL